MIDRRNFIGSIAGGLLAAPFGVHAQKAEKLYRIGYLRVGAVPVPANFWDAMRRFAWIEDQNLTFEPRYAETEDQLPVLAADLAKLKVDAILTSGTPAAWAAKNATAIIPIVFIIGGDPVERGLVASLARPGGNLTGFVYGVYDEKLLETLKITLTKIARVAVPYPAAWQNANEPEPPIFAAARALGLQLQGFPMKGPDDLARLYTAARNARMDAVVFFDIAWPFRPQLEQMAVESVKNRLPAIFFDRKFVEAGGLLAYGPVRDQHWPRIATQIDRILRGVKPADLPVEQPTKFELVINLKTAKALGIAIPQSALVRADEVIR
jgi:putative tryptophan/tyrosine transport system substrate-binding protein